MPLSAKTDTETVFPAEGRLVTFPDSPFQLFQPYPPAGDQPAAIDALIDGLESGLSYQTLLGVTGSGKTFTMANRSEEHTSELQSH